MSKSHRNSQQHKVAAGQGLFGDGCAASENQRALVSDTMQSTKRGNTNGLFPQASRLSDWMLAALSIRAIAPLPQPRDALSATAPSVGERHPLAALPERFRKLADAAQDDPFVAAARRYLAGPSI